MNFGNFFLLLFSFCSFIVGLFVWFKRSDRIGTVYFAYSFFMAIWGSLLSFTLSDDITYESALMLARISNSASIFIAPTWYYFTLLFCKFKSKTYSRLIALFYALSIFLVATAPTDLFIKDLHAISGFKFYPAPGPAYVVFFISFFVIVILSFMNLYKRIKQTQGKERTRTLGLFAAASFGYIGGGLSFLPVFDIPIPMYNFAIMPLYPFLLAYFMTREQLFDAEEFATIAHKEKLATIGTLAASVNHEIRNPLYVIKSQGEGFVEKLKEGFYQGEEGFAKSCEIIEKSITQSARAMDIMKRFSQFAKQESGELNQTKVNLKKTIDNVMQLVSYEVTTEEIEIDIQVPEKLEAMFDPRHLEQILFNLTRNACQEIARKGKISISASILSSSSLSFPHVSGGNLKKENPRSPTKNFGDDKANSVQITITDNGPEIPKDRLNQVFEPFYSTKEEGSGLGLYVTKQLVERNNGKISVESKLDEGTIFTLELLISR